MEFEKKHFIFGGFTIIALIALYFIHSYLTKQIVHKELKNLLKHKKKNQMKKKNIMSNINHRKEKEKEIEMEMEMQMQMQREMDTKNDENIILNQHDMDSYVDVGNDDEDEARNTPSSRGSRVSKDNIGCRDMMDGSRQ
jgi:hypothetical protein